MSGGSAELVRFICDCPVEIAHSLGYDRLTPLHREWIQEMVFGSGDATIQGHRGSYKTTCLIVAFAFIIVLHPGWRTLFLRKTDTDVAEVMTAVAAILEHPYFKALARKLYGVELIVTKATNSAVTTNLKRGVAGADQLLGLGLGSSLTGKHADRVFTDDIVNVKDRVSPAERKRTKLVYMELQNIVNPGGRIVNTGTPWHKDDAFQLMKNIRRWDCYSTGLMTMEQIEAKRASMTRSLFSANYLLKHVADEDAMFTEPCYFFDERLIYDGIAQIDAAYGGSDGTALTIIKKRGDDILVYGRLWEETAVDKALPEIMGIVEELRAGTIYTEFNADRGYLTRDIEAQGHPSVTYTEHMNKYMKIATYLKGQWRNVSFLDCDAAPMDAEYVNQILEYSENAEHDDAPDSLASAIRQLGKGYGIQGSREGP